MSNDLVDLVVGIVTGIILVPVFYHVYFTILEALETICGWNPTADIAKISIPPIFAIPTDLIAVIALLQKCDMDLHK